MITRLYGLKCYDVSSITEVRDSRLQGALHKISSIKNVPLVISTTPIKYDELPSAKEILKEKKRDCLTSLLKRLSPKRQDSDVLRGRQLIIQAGYHATLDSKNLLKNGLSSSFENDAFENGNELDGEGLYVAEDRKTAEGYAKVKSGNAEVLEVWLRLTEDNIKSDEIQKTPAHDIAIRPHAYDNVFFVKSAN